MKLAFIDTETTGTDPKLNGLTQVAGVVGSWDGREFATIREFNELVRPFPSDEITPDALFIQKKTREEVLAYPEPMKVFMALRDLFRTQVAQYDSHDKMFFLGFNSIFDM